MQRPCKIKGDIVGDIDKGRDRPQSDRAQPVLQPFWAGTVFDTAKCATHDQWTGIGRIVRQVALPLYRRFEPAGHFRRIKRFQAPDTGGC